MEFVKSPRGHLGARGHTVDDHWFVESNVRIICE
jgi:hypothetical protein